MAMKCSWRERECNGCMWCYEESKEAEDEDGEDSGTESFM